MPKYIVVVEHSDEFRLVLDATSSEEAQSEAVAKVAANPAAYHHGSTDYGVATVEEATRYECVIFMQNLSDYGEFERILYPDSTDSLVVTSNAQEQAALEHLKQWDNGDPVENHQWDSPASGSGVRSYSADGYLMTWHTGLGWAALYRVIPGATP